jgi:pimeloyl-ACP methyl ester carboxylesterase
MTMAFSAPGQTIQLAEGPQPFKEALAIKRSGEGGRSPLHTDAIEAKIVAGNWNFPKEGEEVETPSGSKQSWTRISAKSDDWFDGDALRGGYLAVQCVAEKEETRILAAAGHSMVYVNGEPRGGDVYSYGYMRVPVALRAGTNEFLFATGRGRMRAVLEMPKKDVCFDTSDMTLPDLILGQPAPEWGGIVVINATTNWLRNLTVKTELKGTSTETKAPAIPPMTLRKIPFRLAGPIPAEGDSGETRLTLGTKTEKKFEALDETTFKLRVRSPQSTQKRTFVSRIDGSVQYFAVHPARPVRPGQSPALFLSLHGASVEATSQVDAYSSKTWGHIVAPTNRRPYGFDWEDIGRLDAMEVLTIAQNLFQTDPRRTYLTGHSMGGHGTWNIGAIYPDRFAAIGPSAGWISFWTYTGPRDRSRDKNEMDLFVQRAVGPSDTLKLVDNYKQEGVYVLHGDADDNVPVREARAMKEQLSKFHHDFEYFEQPGAGHWWENSDEPGAECMDWPQMYDLFARHSIPALDEVRDVEFTTVNPAVSAWCHWAGIIAQEKMLAPSSIAIRWDPGAGRFNGTTTNVARLILSLQQSLPREKIQVQLDGQKLENLPWPEARQLLLEKKGTNWAQAAKFPREDKGPHRYGLFKEGFNNRFMLVYATGGTEEENTWARNKARFDAETYYYRGNGAVDVLPDVEFQAEAEPERNVILYGNFSNNKAWKALLGSSPVQVNDGALAVRNELLDGADLACLFVRPRPGSDSAVVSVVSGTSLAGMRLTDRLPYFMSGVAYPDFIVLSPAMLKERGKGVEWAGYFGVNWEPSSGEFLRKSE